MTVRQRSVCRLSQFCVGSQVSYFNGVFILCDWQNECNKRILRIKHIICYCVYDDSLLIKWVSSSEAFCSGGKFTGMPVCVCVYVGGMIG